MTYSVSYRRMLTRMDYYNYQNGLIYRHLNQEGGWEDHQQNCRNFIIKAIDLLRPEKVTILGSGWLLELPFAELIERTGTLRLVDIIHPPDVIVQVKGLKNVELIEQDITGGLIEQIWNKGGRYRLFKKSLSFEDIIIPDYITNHDPGLVISLNILTQLEALLINFLKKKTKIQEDQLILFRTGIQKKHIEFLMKHKSVIISDYAEIITKNSGNIETIPTLLTELPPYEVKEEWIWNFDQTGADLYNSRSQLKVFALIN